MSDDAIAHQGENPDVDIYAAEREKNRKVIRSTIFLLSVLSVVSVLAFMASLANRLAQFTEQPDGSFPLSHWLDVWMGVSGIASIIFFVSTVFLVNKTWPHLFRLQPAVAIVFPVLLILGSIAGVTKMMDTTWEANMKSWAMERYGVEYETINKGWTPPVMGPGGCTTSYNPFAPNGLRHSSSCDVESSGKDTYTLVTKEGRYAAELLYTGYGYKAYKATADPHAEELPVRSY